MDLLAIRRQFPLLASSDIAYLDSAATTQKSHAVLEAVDAFYRTTNGNPHRGLYPLADSATEAFEAGRRAVQRFIGAAHRSEIIVTKNATEAINLVARGVGSTMREGDVIAITRLEHHSNVIPWMQVAAERGARIAWISLDVYGLPDMRMLETVLRKGHVRVVAVTGLSNVLGTLPNVRAICALAHQHDALVCVDAAQWAAHRAIDVRAIDCDALAFSGHKIYGPTGIGILYGKESLLDSFPPFLGGGMMIRTVEDETFTAADLPAKFEAGTQPIAEMAGLRAAIEWLTSLDADARMAHERSLLAHVIDALRSIDGVTILGPADPDRIAGCVSFTVDGVHPHDLAELLGREGVCIRAGHHCTQPLHRHLGIIASARVSVGVYTMKEEIDRFREAVERAKKRLAC